MSPLSLSVAAPLDLKRLGDQVLVAGPAAVELRLFELTSNLGVGQTGGADDDAASATAKQVWLDAGANSYAATDEIDEVTLYHPLASLGGTPDVAALSAGSRAWALFNPQSGRWEIVAPAPQPVIRFRTQESFTVADATVGVIRWQWTGSDYDEVGDEFDVYNALGMFSSATSGALGFATWMSDRGVYEITQLACDA